MEPKPKKRKMLELDFDNESDEDGDEDDALDAELRRFSLSSVMIPQLQVQK